MTITPATTATTMAIPTVIALSIKPTKGTRAVTVRCPFCRRKHFHGWPYGSQTIGSRVSHCWRGPVGSYRIEPPANYQEANHE